MMGIGKERKGFKRQFLAQGLLIGGHLIIADNLIIYQIK
jgi:hypothetical protein